MKTIIALVVVLVLASSVVLASEKVLLFRFKAVGVDEELIDAVMLVYGGALEEDGKYMPVSVIDVIGDVACYEPSCAAPLAADAGFQRALTGSLTRLGMKIIVRVHLIDAATEQVVFSDDGVSLTEDDLDVVLKRLAKSVALEKKMERTAEVGMITGQEFEEVRRRESYSSKYIRVGFLWPISESMGGADRLTVLDLAYQYDTPDFFLSGRSGVHWGGDLDTDGGYAVDIAFLDAKLGRYASRSDFSPFVSAGIGLHWVREKKRIVRREGDHIEYTDDSDSGTGLALLAGCGFTAFRTYNFQFQVDVEYILIMMDLEYGNKPQGVMFTFCIKKGQQRN